MARGLAREGFDLDLRHGQIAEEQVRRMLTDCTIEVKSDDRARETGNLFFEFRQKGRPSGIAVTTAKWYAVKLDEHTIIFLETRRLIEICRHVYRTRKSRIVRGGDYGNYEGVIVPVVDLVKPWRQ